MAVRALSFVNFRHLERMNHNKLHLFTRITSEDSTEYLPQCLSDYKAALKEFRDWFASAELVVRTTKHGYQQLDKAKNSELYSRLDAINIWGFFITNKARKTISVHQIVLFLQQGWKYYVKGWGIEAGKADTHHLDHNPLNNQPSNLCYCSPALNKLCSQAVRFGNYYGKPSNSATESEIEAAEIVHETVERTFHAWGLAAPVLKVIHWLLHLPKNLRTSVVNNWVTLPQVIHATVTI